MKKVIAIVLVMASVLTLFCSCNKENSDNSGEKSFFDKLKFWEDKPIQSGDFEYIVLEDDTAKITKYLAQDERAIYEMPASVDEYTITVIGAEAFKGAQGIREVRTPDTLKVIEAHAFEGSSVKVIKMNKSKDLTEIGEYAFAECDNLIQADMPAKLETLGDYAFYHCDILRIAQFRGNTETIGAYTFDACPKVKIYLKDTATNVKNYVDTYGFNFVYQNAVKK